MLRRSFDLVGGFGLLYFPRWIYERLVGFVFVVLDLLFVLGYPFFLYFVVEFGWEMMMEGFRWGWGEF